MYNLYTETRTQPGPLHSPMKVGEYFFLFTKCRQFSLPLQGGGGEGECWRKVNVNIYPSGEAEGRSRTGRGHEGTLSTERGGAWGVTTGRWPEAGAPEWGLTGQCL